MDQEPTCNCPDPALCQRLKKHINGRLWEIWNNINIDPKTAQKYRDLWERQAKLPTPKPLPRKPLLPQKGGQPNGEPKRGCNCGRR